MADGQMDDDALQEARREVAGDTYGAFDFGRDVLDACGWTVASGGPDGDEWHKVVFLENVDDPAGDSVKGCIAVRFVRGGDAVRSVVGKVGEEVVGEKPFPGHRYGRPGS